MNIPICSVHYCPAYKDAQEFLPGDFILVHSNSLLSKLIQFGQKLRYKNKRYYRWNHAAIIINTDGQLLEAVANGIIVGNLSKYHNADYYLVRINATDDDRQEAVNFAKSCIGDGYGFVKFISIGLSLLTGLKFSFGFSGQEVCSGLVARSLERTTAIFKEGPANVTPAGLAQYFMTTLS